MNPKVSIIVPVFNEKDSLDLLFTEIRQVMQEASIEYEILFVNDGSRDGSGEILEQLAKQYPEVKYIEFKRNFGPVEI